MDDNRGTQRRDVTPADREVARLRRVWESKVRHVSRLYADLERAIRDAEFAERAYNLAQRAAKLDRTDLGVGVVALLGFMS
jgi:outer membrane protein TolC